MVLQGRETLCALPDHDQGAEQATADSAKDAMLNEKKVPIREGRHSSGTHRFQLRKRVDLVEITGPGRTVKALRRKEDPDKSVAVPAQRRSGDKGSSGNDRARCLSARGHLNGGPGVLGSRKDSCDHANLCWRPAPAMMLGLVGLFML